MGDDRCLELSAFLHDERDELQTLVVIRKVGVPYVPFGFAVEVEPIYQRIPEQVVPGRGRADPKVLLVPFFVVHLG